MSHGLELNQRALWSASGGLQGASNTADILMGVLVKVCIYHAKRTIARMFLIAEQISGQSLGFRNAE